MKSQKPTLNREQELSEEDKNIMNAEKYGDSCEVWYEEIFRDKALAFKQGQLSEQNKLNNYVKNRIATLKFQLVHIRDENSRNQFYARISELKGIRDEVQGKGSKEKKQIQGEHK